MTTDPETDPETIEITCGPCVFCGKQTTLTVPYAHYQRWKGGMHIQYAFPTLDADERELLISGTDKECFDKFLGDPDLER